MTTVQLFIKIIYTDADITCTLCHVFVCHNAYVRMCVRDFPITLSQVKLGNTLLEQIV